MRYDAGVSSAEPSTLTAAEGVTVIVSPGSPIWLMAAGHWKLSNGPSVRVV